MKNLQETIEEMIDNSQYTEAADYVAQELGVKLIFHGTRFESMKWDKDGQKRYIIDCELKRDKKSYKFEFGTSTANSCVEESEWDALGDDNKIDIFAGRGTADYKITGSVKFSISKVDIASIDDEFIKEKANIMIQNYKKSVAEFKASRQPIGYRNMSLSESEAILAVNKAIVKEVDKLKRNKVTSKTKALPQATMPTMYDILACMTWYDPETFEDFCANYGYDEDSRSAEKTYRGVKKEYNALKNMFNEEEMEAISRIN